MDQPRDESEPVEPMPPPPTEAPVGIRLVQDADLTEKSGDPGCVHLRLIDDVLTKSGKPTGKVRCLECGTIFDDPYLKTP